MSWEIITHIDQGVAADRPAANAVPGRHYGWWSTDTKELSISDGSTWTTIGPTAGSGVTYGTPAIVLGTAAAAGSIDEAIRRDATILAFDATVPSSQAFGDSAAAGSAAVAARRDHKHAMPAAPTSVSGNAGTATALQTGRTIDGQTFDGTANITVIAPGTHAATSKATPVDNDEIPLVDSAASNVLKKLLWSNLKATLKTYFDTLYAPGGGAAPAGVSELIYRYTVTGSDKASIDTGADTADAGSNDWTNGDVIEVWICGRTDQAAVRGGVTITVNNDTSSIYDFVFNEVLNATLSGGNSRGTAGWGLFLAGASAGSGEAAYISLEVADYAGTTFNKVGRINNGLASATAATNTVDEGAVQYRSTSALTRIKVAATSTNKLKVGTQILIYKRRSA